MSIFNSNNSVSKRNKEFGERLSKIIPDKDREEFAKNVGVKYETVRVWCNGKNLPNGSQLLKITEKYNIDLHWLLTGKDFKTDIDLEEYKKLDEENRELLKKYFELSEENKKLKQSLKTFLEIINNFQPPEGVDERRRCRFEYDKHLKEIEGIVL